MTSMRSRTSSPRPSISWASIRTRASPTGSSGAPTRLGAATQWPWQLWRRRSEAHAHGRPWRDTDVINSRAPRTNQAIVGTLSLIAFVTGWWPILGLLAAQLAIGLTFGRRYCLPCLLYFEVLQPRFGEGPIEDSRPPRFANIVG